MTQQQRAFESNFAAIFASKVVPRSTAHSTAHMRKLQAFSHKHGPHRRTESHETTSPHGPDFFKTLLSLGGLPYLLLLETARTSRESEDPSCSSTRGSPSAAAL